MVSEGVANPTVGCTDSSGQGLADWVVRHYAEDGYTADASPVSFDDVAMEVQPEQHPVAVGGAQWYHWSGVASYDAAADLLVLKNPAAGWMGIQQRMSRSDWDRLGPWHMVRVMHPAAEGLIETVPPDLSAWDATVGSGILAMMTEDLTEPAQSASTWLPLSSASADVEECLGKNGTMYRWALTVSQGWRYRPA